MSIWEEQFGYSEADKIRILNELPKAQEAPTDQDNLDWNLLLNMKKKKVRIKQHAISLSENIRVNRIPCRLGIQKVPALFSEIEE